MRNHIQIILAIVIALSSSFPAIGGVRGLVVCLSNDGHVAIESQHEAPTCADICERQAAGDDAGRTMAAVEVDCHACVDIALGLFDLNVGRAARSAPGSSEREFVPGPEYPTGCFSTQQYGHGWNGSPQVTMATVNRPASQRALHSVILRL